MRDDRQNVNVIELESRLSLRNSPPRGAERENLILRVDIPLQRISQQIFRTGPLPRVQLQTTSQDDGYSVSFSRIQARALSVQHPTSGPMHLLWQRRLREAQRSLRGMEKKPAIGNHIEMFLPVTVPSPPSPSRYLHARTLPRKYGGKASTSRRTTLICHTSRRWRWPGR